ncbi:MAG: hypothetical protein K2J51_02415 [Alistipes sp.]|nr:hypothetical protein [Alistipes sp.]
MKARRLLLSLVVLLSLCTSVSCGRQMQRRIRIEGVESVERHGWSGIDITLRVRNDSRRDLMLDSCTVHLFTADAPHRPAGIGTLELRGGAGIARRTAGSVRLRMKMRMESPAAAQALWRRLSDGRTDGLHLSVDAEVRAGGRARRISTELLPLSSIFSIFGVSNEDFSDCFNE